MPWEKISRSILGTELKLIQSRNYKNGYLWDVEKKRSSFEACPRCANPSNSRYGISVVKIKEEPLWGKPLWLSIKKHRYYCKYCRKPFTESVPGVLPRRKTTQRLRKAVMQACIDFTNLSRVRRKFFCSSALVYRILYSQLEIKLRERKGASWPKVLGINEHFFYS
jgi:transposase